MPGASLGLLLLLSCVIGPAGCRPLSYDQSGSSSVNRPALGGQPVEGQYIVVFKPQHVAAGGVRAAAAALQAHVAAATAVAAPPAGSHPASSSTSTASPPGGLTIVRSLVGAPHSGQAAAAGALASASQAPGAAAPAPAAAGPQGIVIRLQHPSLLAAVQSAIHVAAVIPDTVVAAQQQQQQSNRCVEAGQLSQGVPAAKVSGSFKWACASRHAELRWVGERCGKAMDRIRYIAVYVVYKGTNVTRRAPDGSECVLARTASGNATSPAWQRLRFGGCGTPPLFARGLPTCVHPAAAAAAGNDSTSSGGSSGGSSSGSGSGSSSAPCLQGMPGAAGAELWAVPLTLAAPVFCGSRLVQSLTYYGARCGPTGQLIAWVRAVGPNGCLLQPAADQIKHNSDVFGSCGVPPGKGVLSPAALPLAVCSGGSGGSSEKQGPPPPPPPPSPSPVAPSPSPAAPPPPAPVDPAPPSPRPPEAPQPPATPPPSPAPQPSPEPAHGPRLPRAPLQAGDAVPAGVSRIEAATAAGVPFVASSATAGSAEAAPPQLLVAVMDSGVDAAHPDLNYAGGVSFATPAGGIADDASPGVDVFGHGSHVAGIIGARNNGVGVVGVSPGVPLFSVKVLNGAGMGMLSDVLSALAWVTAVGVAQGIRVINLSVAAYVDPATPRYQDTFDLVCGVMKGASDAGVVVSAAAGNYGSSLAGYFPAVCPTVAAVAALDGTGRAAAPYSNYVAAGAPAAQLAHMLAAPGSSIRSTVPRARDASGYAEMSGTSMAAPHVAGVAANCILSGACAGAAPAGAAPAAVPSSASSASASSVLSALSSSAAVSAPAPATGVEQLAVLQAAAQQRYAAAEGYGFAGDATSTAGGRYMGYLVWAGAF